MNTPLLRWLPLAVARAPVGVRTKLLLAFLAIVGLLVAIGAVSLAELGRLNQRAEDFVKLQRKIAAYRQIQHSTTSQLYSAATALLVPQAATLDATLRQLNQFGYDLERLQFVAQDEVESLRRVRIEYDAFTTAVGEVIELIRAGNAAEGRKAQVERAGPLADRLERLTNELVNRAEADMLSRIDEGHAGYDASRRWVVAFALGSVVLALGLGYAISWSLIGPLWQMRERFDAIAAGEFTQQVAVPNRDELGELAGHLNRMSGELGRLYQRQAATADVLQVIGNSVADAQPVFDRIVDCGTHLFASNSMTIDLVGDDDRLHLAAYGGTAKDDDAIAANFPMLLETSTSGLAISERRALRFADVLSDVRVPEATRRLCKSLGARSFAVAPMLWEGHGLGAVTVARDTVSPFSDKEIALMQTFADQAVIALQNSRLFNQTKEALEQQTAATEILKVISNSPTDVQPVLDAVARRAALLCDATAAQIFLEAGGMLHSRAGHSSAGVAMSMRGDPVPIQSTSMTGRAVLERTTIHCADVLPLIDTQYPAARPNQQRLGFRAILAVPLTREAGVYGAIFLHREEPRAFLPSQIALVQTFAHQAAIAIENVRLFNETKEALEQQTATAEVLQVMSNSVADTQPVFDRIVDSGIRLFASSSMQINLVGEDGRLYLGAYGGPAGRRAAIAAHFPMPLETSSSGLAIRERRVVRFADVLADDGVPDITRRVVGGGGGHSFAAAPMVWEEQAIGAIIVARDSVSPFSDKEVALLRTFADQAVIAIQNARLFHEIQDKSRQLEAANRHKSEFLANMSHELRTPLNAIIGFSEVLVEKLFGELNDKQLEYLRDIHSSGHHLLTLINDILDLSKIEAGRMELQLASFDLGELLEGAAIFVRERAAQHGLRLALDVPEGLGDWVADPRKIKQVVINLLSNAVKFTPSGGSVTLRARRIAGIDGNAVDIAVIDTGVGIAPDQQLLVFEEFRQAAGEHLRKSEGTGLGLALAKSFVELHGGTIRVDSKPGQGSTFSFSLPQRAAALPQAMPQSDSCATSQETQA